MALLPPSVFTGFECPVCRDPHAVFVDAMHQPEIFRKVQAEHPAEPFVCAFVCGSCRTVFTPAQFLEKVPEILEAEREQHRFWRRLISVLECNAIDT